MQDGGAYAAGVVAGTIVAALLLAALVRFIYVRFAVRRGEVVEWRWLLPIAAVIAVVLLLARAGDEDDDVERAAERAQDCRRTAGTPFVRLGNGLKYRQLDEARRELLAERLPPDVRDLYEARLVLEGGRTVGVVFAAAVGDDPGAQRDFEAGFTDSVRDRGGAPRPDTLAGRAVTTVAVDGQSVVTGFTGCYGLAVSSADLPSAKLIARPLLRD